MCRPGSTPSCMFRVSTPSSDSGGRELRRGHLADRPDDAAVGARPGGSGHLLAHREDLNERLRDHHRRADRAVGRRGPACRDQGRRDPRGHAARDGAGGRGRAGAPRQVINARGELQASEELRAGRRRHSAPNPASLQLRYLQTLLELGADQNSTVVFPLPSTSSPRS